MKLDYLYINFLMNLSMGVTEINTPTKVTWHNFDDLVRQCYRVWGDMTSITV